jgi:DNA-directed RNA polymerase specialized sigma24 family protein
MKNLAVQEETSRDRQVETILETLYEFTPVERDVFVLYQYRSLPLSEISVKLSLSIQEVDRLLSAAQEKLLENLKALRPEIA